LLGFIYIIWLLSSLNNVTHLFTCVYIVWDNTTSAILVRLTTTFSGPQNTRTCTVYEYQPETTE